MESDKEIIIYKADQRACTESDIFRRFSTLNFDEYHILSRNAFGFLQAINDETLAAGNKIVRQLNHNTDLLLLPLFGAISYKDSLSNPDIIGPGQLRIFSALQGQSYEITNPYDNELINYLQIWLKPDAVSFVAQSKQQDFDSSHKNLLFPIFEPARFKNPILKSHTQAFGFIGVFDGRKESAYHLQHPGNGLFAFVVNGAFEFENRLIESRDGLSFRGISKVTFEALSENAILLLLEIPL